MRHTITTLVLLATATTYPSPAFAAPSTNACYTAHGALNDPDVSACPSSSNCCVLNDDAANNFCQPGYCVRSPEQTEAYVDGCTVQPWGSGCSPIVQVCGISQTGPSVTLTRCSDGSVCCNAGNTTCCASGTGMYLDHTGTKFVKLNGHEVVESSSSSSSSSSPTTASAPPNSTSTPSPTPTASSPQSAPNSDGNTDSSTKHGLSKEAIIGIAAAVVAAAGVGIGFLAWQFPKRRAAHRRHGGRAREDWFCMMCYRHRSSSSGNDAISETNNDVTGLTGEKRASEAGPGRYA